MATRRIVTTEKIYEKCKSCEGTGFQSNGFASDCQVCRGYGEIKVSDTKKEYKECI